MRVLTTAGAALGAAMIFATPPANAKAICDLDVRTRFGLYFVTVDDKPFRNKGYVTYDDAVGLRDQLVMSGACVRPARLETCVVQPTGEGDYAIIRAGVRFAVHSMFDTHKAALARARDFERASLCRVAKAGEMPAPGPEPTQVRAASAAGQSAEDPLRAGAAQGRAASAPPASANLSRTRSVAAAQRRGEAPAGGKPETAVSKPRGAPTPDN